MNTTKKTVKILSAVGAGAIMLGATVMGAFAADLSDYPSMFVSEGTFDGYFVVGEAASSTDNLAMTDIATNMFYTESDGTSTTTVEGDAWLAATSSNFLELGEAIPSIETYIDDAALGALADGELSNSKGTAKYDQFLYFDENKNVVDFQEDDDDNVAHMLKINSSSVIARYVMDFTTAMESDITAGVYDDLEDEKLNLLGKEYTIVTATNESAGPKLVLMGGSVSNTLSEGDTATYTVGDSSFDVELVFVDADEAQFLVNGESTGKLNDGETEVLDDGLTTIGVTDILYQDYAGGVHEASFFIGGDKIELADGSSMKVNEETINDAAVLFTKTEASGDISITELSINMTAEDDLYMMPGAKLSEAADLDEPEVLVTENWDIELSGVVVGNEESISLTFGESDGQADLAVELYDGAVSLPLVFINNTNDLIEGEKAGERLVWVGESMFNITKNDYFFLSTSDPTDDTNDARSYLLQYKGSDATTDDSPKAYIKNMATGETLESSVSSTTGAFDLRLGGVTFTFGNESGLADDFDINLTSSSGSTGIDLIASNAGGTGDLNDTRLLSFRTADNHWVRVTDRNINTSTGGDSSAWSVEVIVDDADKVDDTSDLNFVVLNVTLTNSSGELASSAGTGMVSAVTDPEDSDISYRATFFGDMLTATAQTGSPTKYDLTLPESQAEVMLYVTSGATSSTTTTSGDLSIVSVVDATRLDSEVADVSSQNMIVVGGPCVNTVAAELMGNPSDCAEGYTPGVANVKLFENGDSVAMLVAGYSGADTRLAGRVLAHRWDEMSGEEVAIEGSTYSDATIGEPSEAMAEEESTEEAADETTETTE